MSSKHEYESFQQHTEMINGQLRTQEKKVTIKNGIGKKTVRYLGPNGRVIAEKTLPLNDEEMQKILSKTFIPELFHPCIGHCLKKLNGRPAQAGGARGHGAIFFTKHKSRAGSTFGKSRAGSTFGKSRAGSTFGKSRRRSSTAAKARRSRRKNY